MLADVVRAELAKAISNGEFPLGSKLPNQEQLRERFDVSTITLREAVQGLIQDGYVVRRQGSGTYVTRRPSLRNSLDKNFSYTQYLEHAGIRPGKKLLGAKTISATTDIAEALGLRALAPVAEVRRVRTADGQPAIYSIDYVDVNIIDPVSDRKQLNGSLYRLLAHHGHPVDHGVATITPAKADAKLAEYLQVTRGFLLQHLRQVDYDARETPLVLSLEWHVPSVIELSVYRRGPGPVQDEVS
ncbi:GntR family transcriptional regulator [Kribbella ginsengisoli]|uniref:GntR family transcriptional regulator n=1 Tax=Kribbella ginsengisoli TaxID=363865 RepID=UPI0031E432F0